MSGFNLILLTLSVLASRAFVVPGTEGVVCNGSHSYVIASLNNGQYPSSQNCGEYKKSSKYDVRSNQVGLAYSAPLEAAIHDAEYTPDVVEKKPLGLVRSVPKKTIKYIITKKYYQKKTNAPKPVIKKKDSVPKPIITQTGTTLRPDPKKIETKTKKIDPSGLDQKFSGCFHYISQNTQLKSKPLTEQVLEVTNCYRKAAGVPPVTNSAPLADQASSYSQKLTRERMNDKDTAHNLDGSIMNRCNKAGFKKKCGENLSGVSADPDEVVMSWMKSALHEKNLLDPNFTHLGVGFHNGFYSQLFAKQG